MLIIAIISSFARRGVHDLNESTIQRTPKAVYRSQTTRNNRDGLDRCHSRHRIGLPSSDGPGRGRPLRSLKMTG